jgi:serine/threonine protein phosphatase PrpC
VDQYSSLTDTGLKRSNNQDTILSLPKMGLYLVADGVGGRLGGDKASQLCAKVFEERAPALHHLASTYAKEPVSGKRDQVIEALDSVCQEASRAVYEMGQAEGYPGTSTTLVVTLIKKGHCFLAHAGDSRAYLFRNGSLQNLTEDHSMVNELIRQGKMTSDQARTSPYRHVITRALGSSPFIQVDVASLELLPNDRLLLCSDGLTDPVEPDNIYTLMSTGNASESASGLLKAALDGGGPDNVSVIVIDPQPTPAAEQALAKARVLSQLFLFRGLQFSALQRISRFVQEVTFDKGDEIVSQGDDGQTLFAVVQGTLVVSRDDVDLVELVANDHFGEIALSDTLPRSATVTAITDGRMIVIDRISLDKLAKREPTLGTQILWNLLSSVSSRLRLTSARLAESEDNENTMPIY